MQQSNGYIVGFTVGMTVVCGLLLAGAFESLKGLHKKNQEIDIKKSILSAYVTVNPGDDVEAMYAENIEGIVLNAQGEEITQDAKGNPVVADKVNFRKVYKEKDLSKKLFPVYKYKGKEAGTYDAFIIPLYGNGLWDEIWGFVAVGKDFNTIEGASFDHKGETPGLGARITTSEFQARFKGKKIFDADGVMESVKILKGEGNDLASMSGVEHKVDGLSGASMTTGGVNNMLTSYFGYYANYLKKMQTAVK